MDYAQYKEQTGQRGVKNRMLLDSIGANIATFGEVKPEFAAHLENAQTYLEFFENVYGDESLVMNDVWGYCAKVLKKEDVLDHFTPIDIVEAMPVKVGTITIPGPRGAVTIRAPRGADQADVYIYADGTINIKALSPVGKDNCVFTLGKTFIDGFFSAHHYMDKIIVVPWSKDRDGGRSFTNELPPK